MTVLFSKTFKGDLIAYASYEHDRLCFVLVPLRGKINLGPRPQNKILVPFRGHFQKIRRAPPSLLHGRTPVTFIWESPLPGLQSSDFFLLHVSVSPTPMGIFHSPKTSFALRNQDDSPVQNICKKGISVT